MNYKLRLTILFVGLFLLVLSSILSFIYWSYSDFRRDEFYERLRQKSYTTVKLLTIVKGIDNEVLKVIDRNTINEMYDEKVLIFNENDELIYSSIDDEPIPYSLRLLEEIRTKQDRYYVDDDGDEVVGVHYREGPHDYVVLASAYDRYGISKLKNLQNLVVGALLAGTLLIAASSYFYIRQVFKPIDQLNRSIQSINENNLREFVPVGDNKDELAELALNYNQMLGRLYRAFELQRAFVRNASHELKTPLAIIQGKLEKLFSSTGISAEDERLLESLIEDVQSQASLVDSLLLLQRLQTEVPIQKTNLRVDEVLDVTVAEVKQHFRALQVEMDFDSSISNDHQLTVSANPMLMKACFKNILTNAALYSETNELRIKVQPTDSKLQILFSNRGSEALSADIFEPFYRHPMSHEKPGSGLGLSIVSQVLASISGSITYAYDNGYHTFTITIPHLMATS